MLVWREAPIWCRGTWLPSGEAAECVRTVIPVVVRETGSMIEGDTTFDVRKAEAFVMILDGMAIFLCLFFKKARQYGGFGCIINSAKKHEFAITQK